MLSYPVQTGNVTLGREIQFYYKQTSGPRYEIGDTGTAALPVIKPLEAISLFLPLRKSKPYTVENTHHSSSGFILG